MSVSKCPRRSYTLRVQKHNFVFCKKPKNGFVQKHNLEITNRNVRDLGGGVEFFGVLVLADWSPPSSGVEFHSVSSYCRDNYT